MKLTIKTLNQKTLHVEIDDKKTVWDLKEHLCELPEISVRPEQQQLIYSGRVLANQDALKSYSIDERKFLVVMTKKHPLAASQEIIAKDEVKPERKESKSNQSKSPDQPGPSTRKNYKPQKIVPATAQTTASSTVKPTPPPMTAKTLPTIAASAPQMTNQIGNLFPSLDQMPSVKANDPLVRDIMSMGYAETDVRRALTASFNNPDRAIEYLVEGIPDFPEAIAQSPEMGQEETSNALRRLREDPRFNQMRRTIQQHPELISMILARIGELNPEILPLMHDHQDEFLRMLNERDESTDADESGEEIFELLLTEEDRMAVERLVSLGFPREIVVQVYIACDKNEEQTADSLCRYMEDN